jgi:hypothetical protein
MIECVEQRYCIKFCQQLGDFKAETIRKIQQAFGDDAVVLCKSKSGLTASKMATHWWTVTNVPGGHQQAGMQMSLRMCTL